MDVKILIPMCICLMVAFFEAPACLGSVEDQSLLQERLLQNYSRNVRPNVTVTVNLGLTLDNILELDIVNQHMVVSGSLVVFWSDYRLQWDPAAYSNVTELYFTVDDIWRPLLVLTNTVDEIKAIGDSSDQRSMTMCARYDGTLVWLAPAFFKSACSADVTLFPFDTQTCELVISSWLLSEEDLRITPRAKTIALDSCEENGEYHILRSYSSVRRRVFYTGSPLWSFAVFGLELQRRYSYHVINVVLPVLFLEILGVVVFVVPAASGEKLTYALTMLLSLVVMTTLVAEHIPSTSVQVPVLSIFVLEGVIMSVLELVVTVYLLQLHNWHERKLTPGLYHSMLGSTLAACCRGKTNKVTSIDDDTPVIEVQSNDHCPEKKKNAEAFLGTAGQGLSGVINISEMVTTQEKASVSSSEVEGPSYKDIANMLEKACFVIFTLVTVTFILHASLTIAFGAK